MFLRKYSEGSYTPLYLILDQEICGIFHKCIRCDDVMLCFKYYYSQEILHPRHTFQKVGKEDEERSDESYDGDETSLDDSLDDESVMEPPTELNQPIEDSALQRVSSRD